MKRAPLLAFIKARGPCGLALDVHSGVEPVDLTGHYGVSSWERLKERLLAFPLASLSDNCEELHRLHHT
ncbi:uncharacterized [Tachysurus ichikawai]